MNRFLLICAALVAALSFLHPAPVQAGGEQEKSVYGNWPAEMSRENPFADDLARARKRLDASILRFWDIYARDPWNYWLVVDAYYSYADSYQRYTWVLWRYWHWENTHYRFSGRVLTRDVEVLENEKVARPELVVPNAEIKLERNAAFLAGQPLAQKEEAKEAKETAVAHTTVAPPAGYTAKSDDKGRFDFRGLPRGQYKYTVTAEGFFPTSGLVEIAATRQDRDVYLTRLRKFEGTVFTVTADCLPILRPLLSKAGAPGGAVDVASADEVEKILGSDQRIAPQFRRLVPVDGAKVSLNAATSLPFPIPGLPAPGQTPGQTPGQLPPVPGQVPGQLPPAPGQVPGQLPPVGDDKARPVAGQVVPSTSTGADGKFAFAGLTDTSYRVSAEKAGYLPFSALINLERAHTWRRIVIFPFVPFEPGKLEPQKVEQTDVQGKSLNDPFAK